MNEILYVVIIISILRTGESTSPNLVATFPMLSINTDPDQHFLPQNVKNLNIFSQALILRVVTLWSQHFLITKQMFTD